MSSCKRAQRFNGWSVRRPGVKPSEVNHVHPKRVEQAAEFGLDASDVLVFARAVGVSFETAILMMDEQASK